MLPSTFIIIVTTVISPWQSSSPYLNWTQVYWERSYARHWLRHKRYNSEHYRQNSNLHITYSSPAAKIHRRLQWYDNWSIGQGYPWLTVSGRLRSGRGTPRTRIIEMKTFSSLIGTQQMTKHANFLQGNIAIGTAKEKRLLWNTIRTNK